MRWGYVVVGAVLVGALSVAVHRGPWAPPATAESMDHAGHAGMPEGQPVETHAGHKPDGGQQPGAGERPILYWVDPMHPAYTSDRPGKAPDCGMDLVPVYADEKPAGPPGTVSLTMEKRQMIGVRTGVVERRELTRTIRAVARVEYDERRVREVRTRVSGWVEKLYVDFTGKLVEQGDPLFSLYSPELVATQREYLLALEGHSKLKDTTFPEVSEGSASLLEVSKRRLLLWNVTPQDIQNLARTRQPKTSVTLYSPIRGFVIQKDVFEGKYVTPDTELVRVGDLSVVWVNADIYEYELPLVRSGQEASVTLSYFPNERFSGRLIYVYPDVNTDTRTARVRLEFPNPDGKLKPGMYANVEVQVDLGEQLVIPREAVLDSGTTKVAFVAHEDGRFEPRSLELGPETELGVAVRSGLAEGEKVVTSGTYLIDSESRLKSALGAMGHQHGGS